MNMTNHAVIDLLSCITYKGYPVMQFTYLHKVFIGMHVDIMELFQHSVRSGNSIMMNDGTSRSTMVLMKKETTTAHK